MTKPRFRINRLTTRLVQIVGVSLLDVETTNQIVRRESGRAILCWKGKFSYGGRDVDSIFLFFAIRPFLVGSLLFVLFPLTLGVGVLILGDRKLL